MNARVYDPDIGRFLSPDPTVPYVHNPQSFNRYSYTQNNPLNRVDPDGFGDWSLLNGLLNSMGFANAQKGQVKGGQLPNAQTPAHEAITSNNPTSDDNSGQTFGQAAKNAFAETAKTMSGITDAEKSIAFAQEGKLAQAGLHAGKSLAEAGLTAAAVLAALPTGGAAPAVRLGMGVASTEVRALAVGTNTKTATNINHGSQGKHMPNAHNFDPMRSSLNPDINPKSLLDAFHNGTHPTIGKSLRGGFPVVDFGKPIGTSMPANVQTNFGTMHTGKNGAHIVPADPRSVEKAIENLDKVSP